MRAEALRLAAQWMGEERKVLAGMHVDVSMLDLGTDAVIKVDDIRAIRNDALLRPFDGDVKVFIIANAHNMNGFSQNALLRLLEEPPSHARFVLLCRNAGMLLPTVRSRCVLNRLSSGDGDSVLDKTAANDSGISDRAAAFVDALNDPWKRAAAAYSWDKLSRDDLKGVLRSVLACLVDRCRRDGALQEYVNALATVSSMLSALDQNASVGSVCGLLAVSPPLAEK